MPEFDVKAIMRERFGKDSVIALATVYDGVPYVRNVNAYYSDGCFYVITHGLSAKMLHIEKNPLAAVAGEWFSGHGRCENLGYFGKEENAHIAAKLREVFASWIDNGHNDFGDVNTCILRIEITDGIIYFHGTRIEIQKADLK